MGIKRVMSYKDNSRDQLFDSIQIKLMCLSNLNIHLKDAIGVKNWGNADKAKRGIMMIEKTIIFDEIQTFTDLGEYFNLSGERISTIMRKVNRVLRLFLLNKIITIFRNNGIFISSEDQEMYIDLIAKSEKSNIYLNEISKNLDDSNFLNCLSDSLNGVFRTALPPEFFTKPYYD